MNDEEIVCNHCDKTFYLKSFRLQVAKSVSCIYCEKRIYKGVVKVKKSNKQEQIDWLYMRIREYESYARLGDMTFLDDLKKDKEYAKNHFDITLIKLEGLQK